MVKIVYLTTGIPFCKMCSFVQNFFSPHTIKNSHIAQIAQITLVYMTPTRSSFSIYLNN